MENKVGRPKLADNKLKKSSLFMAILCIITVILLFVGGLFKLNIINLNKLKGEIPVYKKYSVGEEFCLKDECFYTIKDNGDSVTALAKYNLYVGNTATYDANVNRYENTIVSGQNHEFRYAHFNVTPLDKNDSRYGKQSEDAKGALTSDGGGVGVIGFAPLSDPIDEEHGKWSSGSGNAQWFDPYGYWANNDGTIKNTYRYDNGYSEGYYVYDQNSNIYPILEAYKSYLESLGYGSVQTSLLSSAQLNALEYTNSDHYDWLVSTSYWTGSTSSDSNYLVNHAAPYHNSIVYYNGDFYNDVYNGVRPVIDINKEDFAEIIGYKDENDYEIGDKFCLNGDKECFYTIANDGTNVTGLAEYNLLVGDNLSYDEENGETIQEPIDTNDPEYGIQSSKTLIDMENFKLGGSIAFSEENYWLDENGNVKEKYEYLDEDQIWVYDENSLLYNYLQDYKSYLNTKLKKNVSNVTLLSIDNVKNVVCYNDNNCQNIPDWLVNTVFYWTGIGNNGNVYCTRGGGNFEECSYDSMFIGLRPVITLPKENINGNHEGDSSQEELPVSDNNNNYSAIITTNPIEGESSDDLFTRFKRKSSSSSNIINHNKNENNNDSNNTTNTNDVTTTTKSSILSKKIDGANILMSKVEKSNHNKFMFLIDVICGSLIVLLLIYLLIKIFSKKKNAN